MDSTTEIYIGNGSAMRCVVTVNNGFGVAVDGTSESAKWLPVAARDPFVLDLTGGSAPGQFNLGSNEVTVVPEGGGESALFVVEIPDTPGGDWQGGSLTIFPGGGSGGCWVLNLNGSVVAGSLSAQP